MKKKILLSLLAVLGIIGVLGAGIVSAHGGFGWVGNFDPEKFAERQQTMFQEQADLLGISIDKIKNYWAEGKNFEEIAEAEGITTEQLQEKMKQAREENMKTQLQTLVNKGIITQEQADARLKVMEERTANGKFGRGHGMMMSGRFMMRGF